MPCKIEIEKSLREKVESLSDSALGVSLKLAQKRQKEINQIFGIPVVRFTAEGDFLNRDIEIPDALIDKYYNNEKALERQENGSEEIELFDPIEDDYFAENIFSGGTFQIDDAGQANFSTFINSKKQRVNLLDRRLNEIKQEKKNVNITKERLKEILKLEIEIKGVLEGVNNQIGLRDEIKELERQTSVSKLMFYAEKDFDRMNHLMRSTNPDDIAEIASILNFYLALDPMNYKNSPLDDHPLHTKSQMFTEGGAIKPEFRPALELYQDLVKKASEFKKALDIQEQKATEKRVNTIETVKDLFDKELSIDDLLYTEAGLADINWVTMMIQDPQFQIGSAQNGLLPQVMYKILNDLANDNKLKAVDMQTRVQDLEPKLKQILGKVGSGPFAGVDYSIFMAKDENGLTQDAIIQRFTSRLYSESYGQNMAWNTRRAEIQKQQGNKDRAYNDLRREIFNWHRERYHFMDITQIAEIRDEFPEFFEGDGKTPSSAEKEKLVELLGETGYQEELDKQKRKLREFLVRRELRKEELESRVANGELSFPEQQRQMNIFDNNHNPVVFLDHLTNFETKGHSLRGKVPNSIYYNSDVFVQMIPRRVQAKVHNKEFLREGTEDTGYYNDDFKKIEDDSTLKAFHDVLMEFQEDVYDNVSPQDREKFNISSIPTYEKTLREILSDPELNVLAQIFEGFRYIVDQIKKALTEIKQRDIIGEESQISSQFLTGNKKEINKQFSIEILRLKQALGIKIIDNIPKGFNLSLLADGHPVLQILAKNLGVAATKTAIQEALPKVDMDNVNLIKILKSGITNQTIKNKSMDLPKVIQGISHGLAMYKARHAALPILEIMKKQYLSIQKASTNNEGIPLRKKLSGKIDKEGLRVRANSQFNSWYNRAVLGNYDKESLAGRYMNEAFGKIGIKSVDDKMGTLREKLGSNPLATREEKDSLERIREVQEGLQEIINTTDNTVEREAAQNKFDALDAIRSGKTRHLSFVAIIENVLFKSIRFLGLGYNFSAAFTNFFEGQISNLIIAASGRYFPEGYLYEAQAIMKYSTLRTFTLHKLKSTNSPVMREGLLKAEIARKLIDNYDILQDAYNELQKASSKSKLDKLGKLHAKELTNRTEYLNQTPIMIATLMDTEITGKDGTKTSLWNAMVDGAKEGKVHGALSDNFQTPQNRYNFEVLSTSERSQLKKDNNNVDFSLFHKTQGRILDTIIKAHGDYNDLRGNMASEKLEGQAMMMFKRWIGMQFYGRFAGEQNNIHVGVVEKGRYRSMTTASGALMGATIGTFLGGPIGTALGAGFGIGVTALFPGIRAVRPESANLGVIGEMAVMTQQLILRIIGLPANIISGRHLIKTDFSKLENEFNRQDLENIKANMMEMAILVWITALLLVVKGIAWDDEDEPDDDRRIAHNILVNKLMQIADQSIMYSNPVSLYKNMTNSIAVVRFLDGVGKTVKHGIGLLEGEDTILGGVNAGQSKFANQFKKTFLPSPLRGKLGFQGASERQYFPSPFDKYFHSEDKKSKKEITARRVKYRYDLEQQGLSEDVVEEKVKEKYRYKLPYESYTEQLEFFDTGKELDKKEVVERKRKIKEEKRKLEK